MKLFRFGPVGAEKPGVVDKNGTHRDLSAVIADIDPATIAAGLESRLANVDLTTLPEVPKGTRFGPCIAQPGNFLAIGLNYVEHAKETNAPLPEEPILFNKAPSCIVGPDDDIVLPRGSEKTDWEVELAFVIGKRAHYVSEADALSYVFGYCVCNDVSERAFQLERGGQWVKGKCAPSFGPIGPYLVTAEEIPDPQKLPLWLEVNGERVQNSDTSDMIFSIRTIVSYVSQFVVLMPGDLITTGTPPGVGLGMKPERYLKRGDAVRLSVEGLGTQTQRVV
ncbi:fumarylacetoacetate hydrolase family protein [Paraburkholderia caledonica]|uniref:2-keto-4-pentenoate hydratase/2-oxohepta-3-ene-1,7-dioic acid hydratase in catechol pathway n=1 Tax=Paraburkholderia caledonica TaxID=134536 RepID=A0AB73IIT5_9BURK|nr:2-keto-4-pentenoate hydratase/2-oxohepta-3-ene-1,7-dioic acid hydratase in catechol pathway [Paraburkholderia caledonica]